MSRGELRRAAVNPPLPMRFATVQFAFARRTRWLRRCAPAGRDEHSELRRWA